MRINSFANSTISLIFTATLVIALSNVQTFVCIAQERGSGTTAGAFFDREVVQEMGEYLVPGSNLSGRRAELLVPTAGGNGTSEYQWGLWRDDVGSRLDGVPATGDEINAAREEDGEFDPDRLTNLYQHSGNQLSFEGTNFSDQPKGETFVAGNLSYRNSVSRTSTDVSEVLLGISTESEQLDFQQLLNLTIGIESTPNVFDVDGNMLQEESADFIYFVERPELGSFRVYEDEETSVEILMEFNSLHLIGFGEVEDASIGFVSSVSVVPEPSGLAVILLGISGLVCGRRRFS